MDRISLYIEHQLVRLKLTVNCKNKLRLNISPLPSYFICITKTCLFKYIETLSPKTKHFQIKTKKKKKKKKKQTKKNTQKTLIFFIFLLQENRGCFIVLVCLSLKSWGLDVDLIVSVPVFSYLYRKFYLQKLKKSK